MKKFLEEAAFQHNPLRILVDFVEKEEKKESAKDYDNWRFVGYVLDIGYNTTTIITRFTITINSEASGLRIRDDSHQHSPGPRVEEYSGR